MSGDSKNWFFYHFGERVDAFNEDDLKRQILEGFEEGRTHLALDLQRTRFLSLPFIKFLSQLSEDLHAKQGRLVLVSPSEKLKRQIGIFGNPDFMTIRRSPEEVPEVEPTPGSPGLDGTAGF